MKLRTHSYLSGRRQRFTSLELRGLCSSCASTLAKKRWLATGLALLPPLALCVFGFSKIPFVLQQVYFAYLALKSKYTWADQFVYGREWVPKFDAQFVVLGDGGRSLPAGLGHALLRVSLGFALPASIAVAWVKMT